MKKLRFGILGTGNIARQFALGVTRSYRCSLTAVGSRSASGADEFAQRLGVPAAHGTYDGLVADKTVDAIYIATPNHLHHEWTLKALRAGKHVLCEKPFALDAAQSEEMFDAAHSAGRVVVEAFMYLCHPQTQAVVETLRRGTIGTVKLIRSNFTFCVAKPDGNTRFVRQLGGGALMDVGCYCISLARLVAGAEPTVVHATARMHSTGVDELTTATMAFPGGMLSTFACGMLTHGDNTAHFGGTEGWIEVPWPWKPAPDRSGYTVCRNIPPRQDQPSGAAVKPRAAIGPRQEVRIPVEGDLFGIEADEFANSVLDGAVPRVTREFTLGNMRVIDEMRKQIGLRFD